MKTTDELNKIFENLIHPEKNKKVRVEKYMNDWLVQVIIDNDVYVNVYYANPPKGIPEFVADTIDIAWNIAMNEAYTTFMAKADEANVQS